MGQKIASLLAVLNLVAFFIPGIKELFLTTIPIPVGVVPLVGIGIWLIFARRKPKETVSSTTGIVPIPRPAERTTPEYKAEIVTFPKERIQYSLEYPLNKQDIADWLKASSPRCADHPVFMIKKRQRSGYGSLGPVRWICAACGHSLSLEDNERLEVLAKTEVLKRATRS